MKKITALILCIVLSLAFSQALANETEISFKVGDSTLLINGKEVTVETPYIAGEGTTLVPLRVITEAFGAEVLWAGETKTITLNYPGRKILLQIDNKNATVNGEAKELPVAPALSASGVTMVPLRFISETFGAAVGYDNGAIKVTKSQKDPNEIITVGNDYWTMKVKASWNPESTGLSARFVNEELKGEVTVLTIPEENYKQSEYKAYVKGTLDELIGKGATVVTDMKAIKLCGYNGYSYTVTQDNEDQTKTTATYYYINECERIIIIKSAYVEGDNTEETQKELRSIIYSFSMIIS